MGHQKALSLDTSIVVGMRGAGKSLWTAVLYNPKSRAFVAEVIQSQALAHVEVRVGFGLDQRNEHFPSETMLAKLVGEAHGPLSVWQAVVLRHALRVLDKSLPFPEDWPGAVKWVANCPDEVGALFRACDDELRTAGKVLLVVFDALDRLAGTWDGVRTLMRGCYRSRPSQARGWARMPSGVLRIPGSRRIWRMR